MYKLLDRQLSNIWYNPIITDQYIIVNNLDKSVSIYALNNLERLADIDSDIQYIKVNSNYLFTETSNKVVVYDLKDFSVVSELIAAEISFGIPLKNFLYYNLNDKEIAKYDLLKREEIWRSNGQFGSQVLSFDNKLLYNEKSFFCKRIFCLKSESGELLWEIDINNFATTEATHSKKKKLVLPYFFVKDKIILLLSDNSLLALDPEEGEIIWQTEGVPYLKQYDESLIGLGATYYTEISSQTGETIRQIDLEDQYNTLGIRNSAASYSVGKDYVYFNDIKKAKVGILHKLSGKIIWSYQLPVDRDVFIPASNVPEIHGNRMYVLDSDGTFHIFDKNG